jgi:hypothetical protein
MKADDVESERLMEINQGADSDQSRQMPINQG